LPNFVREMAKCQTFTPVFGPFVYRSSWLSNLVKECQVPIVYLVTWLPLHNSWVYNLFNMNFPWKCKGMNKLEAYICTISPIFIIIYGIFHICSICIGLLLFQCYWHPKNNWNSIRSFGFDPTLTHFILFELLWIVQKQIYMYWKRSVCARTNTNIQKLLQTARKF